jgi:putative holliday junction resolvase
MLTTKTARQNLFEQGGYKALQHTQIDAVAAQIILEEWLISQI